MALAEYLQYGYVPSPRSILSGATKLEPGTLMTWKPTARSRRQSLLVVGFRAQASTLLRGRTR